MVEAVQIRSDRPYDFLFVLPRVPTIYLTGSFRIVYEICSRLARDGSRVGVFFIRDSERVLSRIRGDALGVSWQDANKFVLYGITLVPVANLRHRISTMFGFRRSESLPERGTASRQPLTILPRRVLAFLIVRSSENIINTRIAYFYFLRGVRKHMTKDCSDDDWFPKGVDFLFGTNLSDSLEARNIFASDYKAAFYVHKHRRANASKYYLIQSIDDDPTLNPDSASIAALSYRLPMRKLVYNKTLFKKFLSDNPIQFKAGFDSVFFRVTKPIEKRPELTVVIPLTDWAPKGAIYGINAMNLLKLEIPEAKVIGFGNLARESVPPFIHYHPYPSREKLRELYNEAAVFVLPSVSETMSITTLEAMHCGCAVVSTENEGVKEYIVPGYNGILVPIRDEISLKNGVKRLLNRPDERIHIARRCVLTAEEFSNEAMYRSFASAIGPDSAASSTS